MLLCVLEPEAGLFSVPSKVLTYLCASRAILGSIPLENLSAKTIVECGAGLVMGPGDTTGFLEAAEKLAGDGDGRTRMGERGRAYAEANFRVTDIADRFEAAVFASLQRG